MVWMMSSISWPGWLGSPCDSASASLTRREISGISSTLAFDRGDGEQADEPVLDGVPSGRAGSRGPPRCRGTRRSAGSSAWSPAPAPADRLDRSAAAARRCAGAARRAGWPGRRWPGPSSHRAALIAEQHEMPVGEPAQQRRDVAAVVGRKVPCAVGVQRVGQDRPARRSAPPSRAPPAARRPSTLGSSAAASATALGSRTATAARGSRSRRRRRRRVGSRRRATSEQLARRIAAHAEHRIHDRRVGDAEPVQQHGDGVHQHRAVVGDDLDRRPERRRDRRSSRPRPWSRPIDRCAADLRVGGQQRRRHHVAATTSIGVVIAGVGGGRVAVRPLVGREICPRETAGESLVDHHRSQPTRR